MDNFHNELGNLSDPRQYTEPLDLKNYSTEWCLKSFRDMLKIRRAEEAIADLYKQQETKTPVHLGVGQEAIAVGISSHLTPKDRVYSGHRSHSHYLALQSPLSTLFAEVLGRETGASGGMGGSMHLYSPDHGFHGSVPIVGATIPVAVGAGLACKMDSRGDVAVCYFGDGASEEGVLHESLNLAKIMKLPVLFVCENNLYSSHLDIHIRQPSNSIARFARAHHIDCSVVDGNDVVEIADIAGRLIANARNGMGPCFIEAVTFRWLGHVGPNDDVDVGIHRSIEELNLWKMRDPIGRLSCSLIENRAIQQQQLNSIENEVNLEIESALGFARNSSFPPHNVLLDYVYADLKS